MILALATPLLLAGQQSTFTTAKGEPLVYENGLIFEVLEYETLTWHDSVSSRHILFKVDPGQDTLAAWTTADSVLNALLDGADFSQMVSQYSDDPGSVNTGGLYEWFPRGMMVKEFEIASFFGDIGVPRLIRTQFGYHIVEPTAKSESTSDEIIPTAISPNPYDGKLEGRVGDQLIAEGKIEGGMKAGKWKEYHANGKTRLTCNYENGMLNGVYTEWDEDGNKKFQADYVDDVTIGEIKMWYPNGVVSTIATARKEMLEVNPDATFDGASEIEVLVEEFELFWESGLPQMSGKMVEGELDGEIKYFHENGELNGTYLYIYGLMSEILNMYDQEGNELDPGTYKDGNGTIKMYDPEGNLTSTQIFENGQFIGEE